MADDTATTCLEITDAWKVFGPKPERALAMAETGSTRSEVLHETGCTIGVRSVSFDVARGETFVVMGLSGSGKSTLIRCVARLTEPTKGSVLLDGEDVTSMSERDLLQVRRDKMSMVFQHFGLLPHRRVIDNVAYGLEIQGVAKLERYARALEVLQAVGLEGFEYQYPQQLSGGMQQRVGLARALAVDPEVLFFDEPFSALDPLIRRDMQDELIDLQKRLQGTIVFITHDFAEAIKLGDRIAIMKDGEFDQIGTAAELITDPATDYVREFTKSIPKAKVLTARDVMHSPNGTERQGTVALDEKIESILPALLVDPRPLSIIDHDGREIGIIDRDAVATVLDQ